jgi:hypothetical protein
MKKSPVLEAYSQSASREILCLLWNPKVYYCVHKSLQVRGPVWHFVRNFFFLQLGFLSPSTNPEAGATCIQNLHVHTHITYNLRYIRLNPRVCVALFVHIVSHLHENMNKSSKIFRDVSMLHLRRFQWVPGIKWPVRGADQSVSSAGVKNAWSYTSTPLPSTSSWRGDDWAVDTC